ncbi:MAG: glycosyltransferase [Arenicellales bacterium]
MNHEAASIRVRLRAELSAFRRSVEDAGIGDAEATVVCIPRHGYATTRVNMESLYEATSARFVVFYVDVASPPVVRDYLRALAREKQNFFCLRVDEPVSRQIARLLVLDLVATPYTLFVDNNMLFEPGWLSRMIRTMEADHCDVVSPLILMHGGAVHFSGSKVLQVSASRVKRKQTTKECPLGADVAGVHPEKLEIDFAESHCCLMRTQAFKDRIDEVFLEGMHNSHTLAVASYLMKERLGCRMLIEPDARVSILPIAFGYDIPWLLGKYNDLDCFNNSYWLHESIVGTSPSSTLRNLKWHRKHLLYALLSMMQGGHLDRDDLLAPQEVPPGVRGYDKPLPRDVEQRIEETVLPLVERRYPRYRRHLMAWLREIDEIIGDIDLKALELATGRRLPWYHRLWRRLKEMPGRAARRASQA